MKKILIFLILFQIIYIRKNINDPFAKIPICLGEKREEIKCPEIPIDLTYSYILLSPKVYSIKNYEGENYIQEFMNYHYYFFKGIKSKTIFFLNESVCDKQVYD